MNLNLGDELAVEIGDIPSRFPLGKVSVTEKAFDAADSNFAHLVACLRAHAQGEWGPIFQADSARRLEVGRGTLYSTHVADPSCPFDPADGGANTLWIATEETIAGRRTTMFLRSER